MDAVVNYFGEADILQKDLQQLTRHVERQGIHAKDMEEGCPPRFLLDILKFSLFLVFTKIHSVCMFIFDSVLNIVYEKF